jgi:aldehyde dehydrogenase (NAD+)
MRTIGTIYIDGAFVMPHGDDRAPLFNPATEKQIGEVRLGDGDDVDVAVAAAKRAFPAMARTTPAERAVMLRRLHKAVAARADDMFAAMVEEYGAPSGFSRFSVQHAAALFEDMSKTVESYAFHRTIGRAEISMRRRRRNHPVEQHARLHCLQARRSAPILTSRRLALLAPL